MTELYTEGKHRVEEQGDKDEETVKTPTYFIKNHKVK